MASGLGELFIELGTVGNVQELEKFVKKVREATEAIEKNAKAQNKQENNIQKTIKSFGTIVGAITAATYALNRLTTDLVKNNQAFLNLTRNSNIALSSFQKWDGIGKMFGIENIAERIKEIPNDASAAIAILIYPEYKHKIFVVTNYILIFFD